MLTLSCICYNFHLEIVQDLFLSVLGLLYLIYQSILQVD